MVRSVSIGSDRGVVTLPNICSRGDILGGVALAVLRSLFIGFSFAEWRNG
jgi:hypothetical protein